MSLTEELDLTDDTADSLESGGQIRPGWHHAKVEDAYDDPKNQGTLVLLFRVLGGKCSGAAHYERLWGADNAKDAKSATTAKNRRKLFLKRLGVIGDGDAGKQVSVDWADAIGRECLIKIKRDTKKQDDGETKEYINLDFAGIYRLNHPEVPAEAWKESGLQPPASSSPGTQQAAPQAPATLTPEQAAAAAKKKKERDVSDLV